LLESRLSSLIGAVEQGDGVAREALFAELYAELHRLARRELTRHRAPVSIGVTSLLHEAYVEMAGRDGVSFPDRARFMAYAARVMRGLIIDHARRRLAVKRGGLFEISSIAADVDRPVDARELTAIGDALDELAKVEPVLAETVDLKFFCGLSFAEIAALRSVSERTVQRHWNKARIYLSRSVRGGVVDG
jgi:RNA polymerase sigma factor (TIGR02999 family)